MFSVLLSGASCSGFLHWPAPRPWCFCLVEGPEASGTGIFFKVWIPWTEEEEGWGLLDQAAWVCRRSGFLYFHRSSSIFNAKPQFSMRPQNEPKTIGTLDPPEGYPLVGWAATPDLEKSSLIREAKEFIDFHQCQVHKATPPPQGQQRGSQPVSQSVRLLFRGCPPASCAQRKLDEAVDRLVKASPPTQVPPATERW